MDAYLDSTWFSYPMGPLTRKFLKVKESEYRGTHSKSISSELEKAFLKKFKEVIENHSEMIAEDILDWMDELIQMKAPAAVNLLAENFKSVSWSESPRYLLTMGASRMLEGKLEEASEYFLMAQALVPEEVTTCINLAEIYYNLERDGDAIVQAEKGIRLEKNNRKLWDIFVSAWTCLEGKVLAAAHARRLSQDVGSWMGKVIAETYQDPEDLLLRAQVLESFYESGDEEDELIVELTGVWGHTQQYEKIEKLFLRLSLTKDSALSWQIYAHTIQSYLAQNKVKQAENVFEKGMGLNIFPNEVKLGLSALISEVQQEQKNKETNHKEGDSSHG